MSLRSKLILIHTGFAAFALIAAVATIYGIDLHVRSAVQSFQTLIDQSLVLEQLRLDAQSQRVALHDLVHGERDDFESMRSAREAFFTRLSEGARFAAILPDDAVQTGWQDVRGAGERLRATMDACVMLVSEGDSDKANKLLIGPIEQEILPELDADLQHVQRAVEEARQQSGAHVLQLNTQILWLALLIGVSGVGLVATGAIVLRRSFIVPIAQVQAGAEQFAAGNLEHRIRISAPDELGALSGVLNNMASSLRISQSKYRSLFENLRDTVLIVDHACRVQECRDGDVPILEVSPEALIGKSLLEARPDWKTANYDCASLAQRVALSGEQVRATSVVLPRLDGTQMYVDILGYPVEYADAQYAAILLRDASEREHFQQLATRAETMEASISFARGIAHDFKNLLQSAVATLSLIEESHPDAEKAKRAIQACQQAAGLSRKLSEFADAGTGNPELISLEETVGLILESLDDLFPETTEIAAKLEPSLHVRMDRDYLTQTVLNLVYNAREAMDGHDDKLTITAHAQTAAHPLRPGTPSRYAVLTVSDTGAGMPAEVKDRLFEPLFSTKPRESSGRRGMGLSIVYSAVTHAGGFIQVDSAVGKGTTFQVFLPLAKLPVAAG